MVIISKQIFYQKIGPEVKCKDLFHNWTDSCVRGNIKTSIHYSKGIIFLYVPIYLFKIAINRKKIDKKFLKNTLKGFLHSCSYSFAFGFITTSSICLTSNVSGRLYYFNFFVLTGFLSGLSVFLEQPDYRYFNTLLWTSMAVESLFNNAYYFKFISFSPIKETIIFMMSSSLLMYLLVNSKNDKIPFNIWFYNPNLSNICCGSEKRKITLNCLRSSGKELLKYFSFGFMLNGVRYLAGAMENVFRNPTKVLFKSIFSKGNFQFGALVGIYAGLFKIMLCILQNYYQTDIPSRAAIAGLIAGLSYYIKPTMNILTFAITTILQIFCYKFYPQSSFLQKLPLSGLLFMFFNTILLGNRILCAETCPKYYAKMLSIGSAGKIDEIYTNLINKYFFS